MHRLADRYIKWHSAPRRYRDLKFFIGSGAERVQVLYL
jgi:hypothetical protein